MKEEKIMLKANFMVVKMLILISFVIFLTKCNWLSGIFSMTPSREAAIKSLEENMLNPKIPLVLMRTSHGGMIFEIYADKAPKTAANFIDLGLGKKSFFDPKTNKQVKRPYYDDLIFHRVIPNFMIQGGDITRKWNRWARL